MRIYIWSIITAFQAIYFILTSKTFFSVAGSGFNYFKNFEEIQYFSNPKYKSIKNVVVCGISILKLPFVAKTNLAH